MPTFDLSVTSLRDFTAALLAVAPGDNDIAFEIVNPRGAHALAVGIDQPVTVEVRGSVGYYCAGMNDGGAVTRMSYVALSNGTSLTGNQPCEPIGSPSATAP